MATSSTNPLGVVDALLRGFWGCGGCAGGDGSRALSSSRRWDIRIASSRSHSLSKIIFNSVGIGSAGSNGGVGDDDERSIGDGHDMHSERAFYFTELERTSHQIDQKFQTRGTLSNPRIYREKAYRSFGIPGQVPWYLPGAHRQTGSGTNNNHK